MGVISASLAIFNLLPVIPLDGGHLFVFGIEKIRGKAFPPKIDEFIARFVNRVIVSFGASMLALVRMTTK